MRDFGSGFLDGTNYFTEPTVFRALKFDIFRTEDRNFGMGFVQSMTLGRIRAYKDNVYGIRLRCNKFRCTRAQSNVISEEALGNCFSLERLCDRIPGHSSNRAVSVTACVAIRPRGLVSGTGMLVFVWTSRLAKFSRHLNCHHGRTPFRMAFHKPAAGSTIVLCWTLMIPTLREPWFVGGSASRYSNQSQLVSRWRERHRNCTHAKNTWLANFIVGGFNRMRRIAPQAIYLISDYIVDNKMAISPQ